MPAPQFTLSTTRTPVGPAHHIAFTIPTGYCEPAEFASAAHAALDGFTARAGFGAILDGRGPIWGYGLLAARVRPTAWLAFRDPRLGLVIVESQTFGVVVGNVVHWNDGIEQGVVMAVCGPPHSGKSVFLAALYRQLLARRPSQFVFLQRACPDGEGMWSAESTPDVAQALRQKSGFTPEFTAAILCDLDGLAATFPLVLVDMPGRRDAIAEALLDRTSHAVILSSRPEESAAWSELCRARGCELLAVLDSCRSSGESGGNSALDVSAIPIRGQLYDLDRAGKSDPYQTALEELADWLVRSIHRLTPRPLAAPIEAQALNK